MNTPSPPEPEYAQPERLAERLERRALSQIAWLTRNAGHLDFDTRLAKVADLVTVANFVRARASIAKGTSNAR